MTAEEWDSCTDPERMLQFLRDSGRASDRKLRLFAVACCRLFWDQLNIDATRTAVETNERYADSRATEKELSRARSAAHNAAWYARHYGAEQPQPWEDPSRRRHYRERLGEATDEVLRRLYFVAFMANATQRLRSDEMPMLRADPLLARCSPSFFRDIFGNPFRPPPPLPPSVLGWRDGLVVQLAQAAYEDRLLPSGHLDPARLALLADALLDAGCTDPDLLDHLRGPEPHVKGCWAVDLVLGRE